MAVGRISGPLLKSNLIRNGIDLAFETDLLYLDVKNQRIGIKTVSPTHELQVNGTTKTTDLIVDNCAYIAGVKICDNTIEATDSQYLNLGTLDNVVYNNKLRVDSIDIEGNVISTNNLDSSADVNLEFRPHGSGTVEIHSNLNVDGNIHATGNITADGNITIGDGTGNDTISINAEVASDLIPDADSVYTLGNSTKAWNDVWVNRLISSTVSADLLEVDGIDLGLRQGNIIYVAENGDDTNSGTHPQDPVGSLKYALDNLAQDGDAIHIYPGVYQEEFPLTVPVGVSIKGLGLRAVKITPTTDTEYNDAFLLNGQNTIEDLTVADFYSGGRYFNVTDIVDADTIKINVGTSPFAHTYVSGGDINFSDSTAPNLVTGATYNNTTGELTINLASPHFTHVGQRAFLRNLVFSCNGGNRTFPDNGYAFRFATDFEVTSRSPYIKNITVITKGSTTTLEDPRGFNAGDAGKGAYVDGAYATANSKEASMLFHSATFITPGVDTITATNGARIEWLNCFTYFADRSIYAFDSNDGLKGDGKTRIRLSGLTGTAPAAGQTVTFDSTDSSTTVGPLTIESIENTDTLVIDGKDTDLVGFDTTPASITFSGGGSATTIEHLDLRDFGAEIRLIGSASIYGNYGLVGDGPGVLMYAIGHNLAYIGNGKEVTNDPVTVIQDNEIVESNDAQIRYNSVDHKGDFRVGDLFYVNQETGEVSFNAANFTINTSNGLTISDGPNTTLITAEKIDTGNLRITGNTISSTSGDVNIDASSNQVNLNSNVNIDGNLDVTGNVTIGGNITIGDEASDTIQFVAGIDSDIIPSTTSVYSLGTSLLRWSNLWVTEANIGDFEIRDNYIQTTESNADLELRANGTGNILIPNNDVQIDNNLTIVGDTDLQDTTIVGTITHTGSYTQTGNTTVTGNVTVTQDLDVTGSAQFEEILVDDNYITTTTSNADLELRASGTGNVLIPNNDVTINGDLTVNGEIQTVNITTSGAIVADSFTTGDILVDENYITTTNSNSNLELRASGTGEILIPSNDVTIEQDLTVSGDTDLQDTTVTGTITHAGDTTQTGNYTITGLFTNGDIQISGNVIETTDSNSDLELRASGTGKILVPNNNVQIDNNLTVSGATDLQNTTVTGTVTHTGNYNQTGNFTIGGEISNGNILIEDNFITTTDSNSDLELRANSTGRILIPSNNVQIDNNLTVIGVTSLDNTNLTGTLTHTGNINQTGNFTIAGEFTNGDILINTNYITTTTSNSDLELRASGTGEILIPDNNLQIDNNLTVDGNTTLDEVTVNGNITHTGDATQTGNYNITGSFYNGDIQINNNSIVTTNTNSDLELRAAGSGIISIPDNDVVIDNNLTVNGTTTINNNVTVNGDITQTGNVTQTGNINLSGTLSTGNIVISGNVLETTDSNSDLELRASGTGEILIPSNDVTIEQNLTVNGDTVLAGTTITGTITHVGDTSQTGNATVTGNVTVTQDLDVSGSAQFEEILVDDNYITTTTSNADLELRANGTGNVLIPNNDVTINNDLTVTGTITVGDINSAGTITANRFSTGDILIDDNFITTTTSNSNLELRANGTGNILIPNNDVQIDNNLTVNGSTNLQDTTVTGTITHTGNVIQTGNFDIAGTISTGEIQISGNVIETTDSNSDLELRASGTGEVLIPSNDVRISNNLYVLGDATLGDTTLTGNVNITGDITQSGDYSITSDVTVGGNLTVTRSAQFEEILIDDNFITTTSSNADLELRANGTGNILIPNNNVTISNNLTVTGTINVGNVVSTGLIQANNFTTGDILVDDNYITTTTSNSDLELRANGTGSILIADLEFNQSTITSTSDINFVPGTGVVNIDGDSALRLPVGDSSQRPVTEQTGQIRYNTEITQFEGYNGTNWTSLGGVIDNDRDTFVTAELTPGANDNTVRFTIENNVIVDINSDRLNAPRVTVDDIEIDGNVISTTTTNTDLVLSANGTGRVSFENIGFVDNSIINTSASGNTRFVVSGTGYVEFIDPYGVVLPVGDNTTRPAGVTGMVRYNTEDTRVELYDGTNWVSVAGASGGISFQDAEEIAIEKVLIFG